MRVQTIRFMNSVWIFFMIAAFLLAPGVARAQAMDAQVEAESLLDEAVTLMAAKQFARACPKLEKVTQLVPGGIGAKIALAECYLGLGRMASAWRQYVLAEVLANRAGDTRVYEIRDASRRLKSRLATLTIVLSDSVRSLDGLTIHLDGKEQAPESWGMAIPVDMGVHDVQVKAPGRRLWQEEIRIKLNGERKKTTIPMLEVESNAISRILWEPDFSQSRKGMIVAGSGLTIAGIGTGILFAILAHNKQNDVMRAMEPIRFRRSVNEPICPVDRFDPGCNNLRSLIQDHDRDSGIMAGSFIVAGVAAAATVTLRLASGKKVETNDNRGSFLVVPSLSGISIMGTF